MTKHWLLNFTFFLWGCLVLHAQNEQILYDFAEIPQSIMINPGVETPYKWYGGIPVLSGISSQAGFSGLTLSDVFANDGIDITDKIRARVINGFSEKEELSGTTQAEILNVGFRGKNRPQNFYSFGMYLESDVIGYWFKDLAILGFEGNANQLGRRFDLSHIKTRGELVSVFHVGLNRKINRKLTLGIRAKLYSSIFNFNSSRNKGYFVTNEGENNFIENTLDADLEIRTSGIKSILDDDGEDDAFVPKTIAKRALLGGNLGLGADFGFTYHLNKQLLITGSLLDVGFIYHTKDIQNYTLKGSATVEGVEVILPDIFINNTSQDFWQDLVDEVEELVPFDNNTNNYITFRPTKLYGSMRYNFGEQKEKEGEDCNCDYNDPYKLRDMGKYNNGIGGQIYMINRPRGPQTALTAFYQKRLGRFLSAKTTYTIDKFSATNIGFGFSVHVGPVNIYAVADNLLAYRNLANSHYASFQFGLNIISWGKK